MAALISKYVEALNEEKIEFLKLCENKKSYKNLRNITESSYIMVHEKTVMPTKLKKFNNNFLDKLIFTSIFVPKFWLHWILTVSKGHDTFIYKQSETPKYNKFLHIMTEFSNLWLSDNTTAYELEIQYEQNNIMVSIVSQEKCFGKVNISYEELECSCLISLGVLLNFEKRKQLIFEIPYKMIIFIIYHGIILLSKMIQTIEDIKLLNSLICKYHSFFVMWDNECLTIINYLSSCLR